MEVEGAGRSTQIPKDWMMVKERMNFLDIPLLDGHVQKLATILTEP
jgi:hypothetical protein